MKFTIVRERWSPDMRYVRASDMTMLAVVVLMSYVHTAILPVTVGRLFGHLAGCPTFFQNSSYGKLMM